MVQEGIEVPIGYLEVKIHKKSTLGLFLSACIYELFGRGERI